MLDENLDSQLLKKQRAPRNSVKMVHAALDEDKKGEIILRGVISADSLDYLKAGAYQREILPVSKINDLVEAFQKGSVPDVDLGMRGGSFIEKDGAFYLQDEVYIIDGLQRRTAAQKVIQTGNVPRLGATVHFNTSEEWERDRFRILNTTATKLSPNVLLKNMTVEYNSLEMLHTLCKDRNFVLANKVSWRQRMVREDLITALILCKTVSFLHSRFGPTRSTRISELVPNLEKLYNKLGRGTLRENTRSFWEMMDECFKVRYITFKEGAAPLRGNFLMTMAEVLSDHVNFWRDTKLQIDAPMRKKIALFPINDPEISRLCGAGGQAAEILYQLIVKHINSGKRTKKLTPSKRDLKRNSTDAQSNESESEE